MAGLTHKTLVGLLWTAWGKGGHLALTLIALAVLARLLSPREFGTVSAALVVIEFSTIFSRLGLGPAVVQREALEDRHLASAFYGSIGLGMLVGGAVWVAAPAAAAFFHNPEVTPVLRTLAVVFPLRGITTVAESLALRQLQFRWIANVDLVSYAVGHVAVAILLALLGLGVWALVFGALTQSALKSVVYLVAYRPPVGRWPEWKASKELLHFGTGFTIARVANQMALQGDNLIVGHSLGAAALGIYGRAYNLMSAPASALGKVLDDVLFPTLARVQHDVVRLGRAFRQGVATIALITLPASVVAFLLAPELVLLVLGPQWSEVVAPFRILAIGLLFRTSYKMSDSLARSTGVVYRRAWRQIIYAVLVIAGSYVGARWGLSGVAWGVLGAVVVNFLLMSHLSLQVCRMSWSSYLRVYRPAVANAACLGLACWACATLARDQQLSEAAVLLASGLGVLTTLAVLLVRFPHWALGPEGQQALGLLRPYVQRIGPSRRAGVAWRTLLRIAPQDDKVN